VDELYTKYRLTQRRLDQQRGEQVEEKRRKLKNRIDSKVPKIDKFSDYLAGQRFEHFDVVEKYNNRKGEEVVLKPPLRERERRSKEKTIGSRSKSRVLRQDYINYLNASGEKGLSRKLDQCWMQGGSGSKATRQGLRQGRGVGGQKVYKFGREVRDSGSESSSSEGEQQVTLRLKGKDKKVVYTNYSGRKGQEGSDGESIEGDLYLQDSRGPPSTQTWGENKENTGSGNRKLSGKREKGREENAREELGLARESEEVRKPVESHRREDESLSPEPPEEKAVVDPNRVDYLAEFLIGDKNKSKFKRAVNKVKMTGLLCKGYQPSPVEPMMQEEESNALPTPDESKTEAEEETNKKSKLGIGTLMNLKSKMKNKAEEARKASKERLLIDRLPEPGMKKNRIVTNGQPLSNFGPSPIQAEKSRKTQPSLTAGDIMEAKKRREAEVRRQKEFEALQREMFKEYFAEEDAEEEKRLAGERQKERDLAEKKRREGLDQRAKLEETRMRLKEENERRKKAEEEARKQVQEAKLRQAEEAREALRMPQRPVEEEGTVKERVEPSSGEQGPGLETVEKGVERPLEESKGEEGETGKDVQKDEEGRKEGGDEEGLPCLPLIESETIELIVSRVAVDGQGNVVEQEGQKEAKVERESKRSSRIQSDLTLPLEDGICIVEDIGEGVLEAAFPLGGLSRKNTVRSQGHGRQGPMDEHSKVEQAVNDSDTLITDQVDLEELNRLLDFQIAQASAGNGGGLAQEERGGQEKHEIPVVEVDLAEIERRGGEATEQRSPNDGWPPTTVDKG
jgi:hypothetical protein